MTEKKFDGGSSNGGSADGRLPATELLMMVSGGATLPAATLRTPPPREAFHAQEQRIFHPPKPHFVSDANKLEISNYLESQFHSMYPGATYSWLSSPMNSYWCQGFQLNNLNSINGTSNEKVWNWIGGNKCPLGSTSLTAQSESLVPGYKDYTYTDSVSCWSSLEVPKVPTCTCHTAPSTALCINDFVGENLHVSEDSKNSRARDAPLMLFPTAERNAIFQEHTRNLNYEEVLESTIDGRSKVHKQPILVPSLDEFDDDNKYNGLVVLIKKELSNSDVGNVGRIVLPKREAEANLPALFEREGMTLFMADLVLQTTWRFRYRFWPNNKSRMYILECTGDFVRIHGLQSGDYFILYKSATSGDYVVRGKKLTEITNCHGS